MHNIMVLVATVVALAAVYVFYNVMHQEPDRVPIAALPENGLVQAPPSSQAIAANADASHTTPSPDAEDAPTPPEANGTIDKAAEAMQAAASSQSPQPSASAHLAPSATSR